MRAATAQTDGHHKVSRYALITVYAMLSWEVVAAEPPKPSLRNREDQMINFRRAPFVAMASLTLALGFVFHLEAEGAHEYTDTLNRHEELADLVTELVTALHSSIEPGDMRVGLGQELNAMNARIDAMQNEIRSLKLRQGLILAGRIALSVISGIGGGVLSRRLWGRRLRSR